MPRSAWLSTLALLLLALLSSACASYTRPPVADLDLREQGARSEVDSSTIQRGLATADEYDPSVLARDLERIERYYRARGYYEAKVTAARVLDERDGKCAGLDQRSAASQQPPCRVRIEIRVQPGQVVTIGGSVTLPGISLLPFEHAPNISKDIIAASTLKVGEPFDEDEFNTVKDNILKVLHDSGFPFAKVEGKAQVDLVSHTARVSYAVEGGPFARFGEVKIVGLREIPEGRVRGALAITPGETFSQTALDDAQASLLKLGVFSRVDIHSDTSHPERAEVPIEVQVVESKLRTISLGGGASFDVLALNVHLRMGWEHRNFLGGMRKLTVNAVPGADLYPTRFDGSQPVAPTRLLPENSIQVKLEQPGFLEGRTLGTLKTNYDIKPLLFVLPAGADPREERIVGYHTLNASASLKREFLTHWVLWTLGRGQSFTLEPSYNWTTKVPFKYQKDLPAGLVDVNISAPALDLSFDWLDSSQDPHLGLSISNRLELAGGIFQGNVSDVKVVPEVRGYFPLTKRTVTGAWRIKLGFLFPRDYGNTLKQNTQAGQTARLDPDNPNVITDQEKLLLRAFYSGGPNSNRGYPFNSVGPHGPVGFLIPTGVNCAADPSQPTCIRPLGGFTLWEASAELRFKIAGNFGGVLFGDASDVTRNVGHLRLDVPHVSVGPGLRYMTPVGPLRVDIGYRVPGWQALGRKTLPEEEQGTEVGTLFGVSWLPVAINVQLGEAF